MSMKFNTRSFISLLLSFTFLVALASGIVMWVHSSSVIFGLGVWKYTHMYVSFLMALTAIVHFALNWRIYLSYWRRAASEKSPVRELATALAVTVAAVAIIVAVAPTKRGGHGGPADIAAMSVQEVAKASGQSIDKIVDALKKEGVHVHNTADTLKTIAEHNEKKPQDVCKIVQAYMPSPKNQK
jgi:hypothetical protein